MNQILRITLFFVLGFFILHKTQAQTNVPFYNIASTNVLPNSSIINSDEAYTRISSLLGSRRAKYEREYKHYKGQYYFKDNLVINIVAQTFPLKSSRYKILSEMKKGYDAFFYQERGVNKYFSIIKKVKNYHAFVNYTLGDNSSKEAVIIDDQGKYMVSVYVYSEKDSNSVQKAIDMINQIADTITFVVK